MKPIKYFLLLLWWGHYYKNKMHPTRLSYYKHAWKLAKEISKP